jgi:hypothetical protein
VSVARALCLLLVAAGCGNGVHEPLCANRNTHTFDLRTLTQPAPFQIHYPAAWSLQANTNAATLTRASTDAVILVGPTTDRGSMANAQKYLDSIAANYSHASIERFSLGDRQAMRIEFEAPQPILQGVSSTETALHHDYYFVDGSIVDIVTGSANTKSDPEVVCEIDAIALSLQW